MAGGRFQYYYKNGRPNEDLSKWSVNPLTSCRLIGQPKVTWDNLGSLFFKHNKYEWIIETLLNSNQNLYNVIHFCENNPNCVEIEIDKRKSGLCYAGHHIFASSSVDLTKLIDSQSVNATSADKNVTVKWICNYGQEQEAPLDQFLTMIQDLRTDPQKDGIVYKLEWSLSDTYEEHKHLSFLLDLRRYCGDVSGLSHVPDKIGPKEQLIDYVDKFHKKYVEPNTQPSQQIVWTFLLTLGSRNLDCQYINKNLNWDNVKMWTVKLGPVIGLLKQVLDFASQMSDTQSTDFVKIATEQLKQLNDKEYNQSATTLFFETLKSMDSSFDLAVDPDSSTAKRFEATIQQYNAFLEKKHLVQNANNWIEKLKSAESSFVPSLNADKNATENEKIGSIVGQFKAFLEKKHLVQNAGKLMQQIQSIPIDDNVIFAIYKQLFKTNIIKDLKDPDSKAINILAFLSQNVHKNGVVASISVPDSGGKRLILVVNNLGDVKADEMKPLLLDLVKRKGVAAPFVNSRFSLLFDNKIHADLGSVEAFNLFKTIVPDENVDRIDGIVVTEQAVREIAAETWAEGITAATRFLMLSHVFLTRYYDNEDHQNVLTSDSIKKIKELMPKTGEMLTALREKVDQSAAVKDLQLKIEKLTPNLFQLATHLEYALSIMPEGVEPHSSALKELNQTLSSLIESKKMPKKSSK